MTASPVLSLVDEESYRAWQQSLVYKRRKSAAPAGSVEAAADEHDSEEEYRSEVLPLQQGLVDAAEAGPAACSGYLLARLGVTDRAALSQAVPALPAPLTVSEMQRLPVYAEQRIATALNGVVALSEAATPAFWAACHAVWISERMFDDTVGCFLGTAASSSVDSMARNFMRRTGGLECVRGKVSVLTDCPVSAAFWKVRTAQEAAGAAPAGELDFDKAHRILHDPVVWPELAGRSVRSLTALNAPRAKAAVVAALACCWPAEGRHSATARRAVGGVLKAVGRLGHGRSLSLVPWEELYSAAMTGALDGAESSGT